MKDLELHLRCLKWGLWCHEKRYFAPPVPQNILAQFQPRSRPAMEPDGELSSEMAFFNMAVHGLAEEEPEDAICFSLYYFHGFRPVKTLAAAVGISRKTFYERIHRFGQKAQKQAPKIRQIHEDACNGKGLQDEPLQIAAF
jgi:hypothetical protein